MKQIILTFGLISFGFLFSECSNNQATTKKHPEKKVTSKKPLDDHKTIKKHVDPETIDPYLEEIKALLNFKEPIKESLEWKDSVGRHIVITSETGVYYTDLRDNGELYYQNAAVSCFHFVQKNADKKFAQVWKIQDYSKDCPVDAGAKFKRNVLQKTDLNNNGIPEIWVMYYTFCKGDVSPSTLKLIMYEGDQKYKMTGETKVDIGSEYIGGKINSEGKFVEQPFFFEFAKKLWEKNVNEVFGE